MSHCGTSKLRFNIMVYNIGFNINPTIYSINPKVYNINIIVYNILN